MIGHCCYNSHFSGEQSHRHWPVGIGVPHSSEASFMRVWVCCEACRIGSNLGSDYLYTALTQLGWFVPIRVIPWHPARRRKQLQMIRRIWIIIVDHLRFSGTWYSVNTLRRHKVRWKKLRPSNHSQWYESWSGAGPVMGSLRWSSWVWSLERNRERVCSGLHEFGFDL